MHISNKDEMKIVEDTIREARWVGKIAQTSIQKKIIDACEPLLVFIVKQAHDYYNEKIKEFEEAKKKEEKIVRVYDFIRTFSGRDDEAFYLLNFEALWPPRNPHPPLPMIKPKAYHAPLLFGAKTETSCLQIIAIRSIGAMIPCHKPGQNPYVLPLRHSVTISLFAHPVNRMIARRTNKGMAIFFRVLTFFMLL